MATEDQSHILIHSADNVAVDISSDTEKEEFIMSSQQMMQQIDKVNDMVYEGMVFYSEEQAYDRYNEYARKVGFSIRRDKYQKRLDGSVRSRIFVCFKEGKRRPNPNIVRQRTERLETRTGCRARLVVKRDGSGWKVDEIVREHNHEVTSPSKAHLLPSQRRVKEVQGAQINALDDAGITPKEGYNFMARQAGGRSNLGLTYDDYKNYLRKKREEEFGSGDGIALMRYFERKQAENPSFIFSVMLDEDDGAITNIFWMDAIAVVDYSFFGDVVVFDTTYQTNKYGRPFSPFVGVNHHKETIIFGGALLIDERTESFIWLFRTWLSAMSNKAPKKILTDQCPAMAKAIKHVFPETIHRICVWHLYQNAAKHLSQVYKVAGFREDFNHCIYYDDGIEEWQSLWDDMITKYNLGKNQWLQRLYEVRDKWALVFGRETFCADMTTTPRSESTNALLKKFVIRILSMSQFVNQYENLLESRRQSEVESDFNNQQRCHTLYLSVHMLKQAEEVYTHAVFSKFELEYKEFINYMIEEINMVGTVATYEVTRQDKKRLLTFDSSNLQVKCSCKNFEFTGIVCRHMLRVFFHKNIHELPKQYILKRWTKNAKAEAVRDKDSHIILPDCNASMTRRYNDLCHNAVKMVTKGASNEETYSLVKKAIDNTLKELDVVLRSNHSAPSDVPNTGKGSEVERIKISYGREKGRQANGTNTRIIPGLEASQQKKKMRGHSVRQDTSSVVAENTTTRNRTQRGEPRRLIEVEDEQNVNVGENINQAE